MTGQPNAKRLIQTNIYKLSDHSTYRDHGKMWRNADSRSQKELEKEENANTDTRKDTLCTNMLAILYLILNLKQSDVVNLSSQKKELDLLSKGLSFIPTLNSLLNQDMADSQKTETQVIYRNAPTLKIPIQTEVKTHSQTHRLQNTRRPHPKNTA